MSYATITFPRDKLVAAINASVGKVSYRLGAKPKLGSVPGTPGHKVTDCSGYVRWLMWELGQAIPDGSWHQEKWCIVRKFKPTSYKAHAGLKDDRLRIAFIAAKGSTPGHVFLIANGMTIEACGGAGTTRRPWDTPVLKQKVAACYVLTEPMNKIS